MVNLPFFHSAIRGSTLRPPEHEVLQLSVSSEAPTLLNSDRGEKLREGQWLISAILREINQLERVLLHEVTTSSPYRIDPITPPRRAT
jgi:hypothetical protein